MGDRLTQNYVRPTNLYEDEEINISSKPTQVNPGKKGLKCFHVLFIKDPGHFYVTDEICGENWMDKMQKVYNADTFKSTGLFKINGTRVVEGRCYVWKDQNQWWYRVRVENPDTTGDLVLVMLVDIGVRRPVMIDDMMELDPRFSVQPALGGQCAELIDIQQPGNDTVWSDKAIKKMKSLCPFGKPFHVVILSHDVDKLHLILAERSRSTDKPQRTVQSKLVESGVADCFGFGAGRHDLAHIITGVPSYDTKQMKSSMTKGEKKSFENAEDPNRGRHYSTIYRGPVKRIELLSKPSSIKAEGDANRGAMPLKMRQNLAWIIITAFVPGESSASFFIQTRSKCEQLEQLMQDLEKIVQGQAALLVDSIKAGSIVAALIKDEQEVPYWTRVIIKNVEKTEATVGVILIDYGIELKQVPTSNLRKLPKYFREISPFCQRAHLDIVIKDCSKNDQVMDRWTVQMAKRFRNYIYKFVVDDEYYYAWQPQGERPEGRVKLQQFNQDLIYNRDKGQWCPKASPGNSSEYAAINSKMDDPLLRQFFTSVGVGIVYEMTQGEKQPYSFLYLWDDLETQFEIDLVRPSLDPAPQ